MRIVAMRGFSSYDSYWVCKNTVLENFFIMTRPYPFSYTYIST